VNVLDILNSPWAIVPEKYIEIREIYLRHLRGETADLQAIEAKLGKPLENVRQPYVIENGVAVIDLVGVISKRMNLFSEISGGVSTQLAAADFRAALADGEAHSILLNVESPGGNVDGVEELSRTIREARANKPVVALADGLMASAAYWIGSGAEAIYATSRTARVGSIGVIATHVDQSQWDAERGLKYTHITAGKYKGAASSHEPLTEEGRSILQELVDSIYQTFVQDVAVNRGVSPAFVLENMADAKIFIGQAAVDAGLVDGIRTREQVIEDLNRRAEARQSRAQGLEILRYANS
jgi:signal peptide peptidase SppA